MDITHLYAAALSLPVGAALTQIKPVLEWWQKRGERAEHREAAKAQSVAQVEAAKATAAGVVEAAKVAAEVTGQHNTFVAWEALVKELRAERIADRSRIRALEKRLDEAEQKRDNAEAQLRGWEATESAREETFQNMIAERDRAIAERNELKQRVAQLEGEMRTMRKSTPPGGSPAVAPR